MDNNKKIKVIAVVGPTASGKSDLAAVLAESFDGEIISADSMQVYTGMDIGTAKADADLQSRAVHHLIDIQPYWEPWNVMKFQKACRSCIADLDQKKKLPILCGGTGLYVKAALYDYEFEQEQENPELEARLEAMDNVQLIMLLEEKDPGSLEKIHPNNRKRLLRAASIACSGQGKSFREARQQHTPVYDLFLIGIRTDRKKEIERINQRVDAMFQAGLPEEVLRLFADPKTWEYTSFQGIGYKEFRPWLQQNCTLEEVREQIKLHTRQYAKRQMTWFRNQMPVHWYASSDLEAMKKDLAAWLKES